MPDVYRVFRRSLFDYLHRIGQVDAATAADPPVEEGWTTQQGWMEHLAATAAEDWVAEESDGRIVGWAQSVERDGLLELTLFFVHPRAQSRGVGRGLLERAFPLGRGTARTIIATQDPPALGLYLRFGVGYATTSAELLGQPIASEIKTDLVIERANAGAEATIVALERELLGHARIVDVRFLVERQPVWLALRGGRAVGFAFGNLGANAGPVAALDPADLPALLATVENEAAGRGVEELGFMVPMVNATALAHLITRRFRIDPFYTFVLASDDRMQLDRWVHTQPGFIV